MGNWPKPHSRTTLGMKSMENLYSFGLVYMVSDMPGFIGQYAFGNL